MGRLVWRRHETSMVASRQFQGKVFFLQKGGWADYMCPLTFSRLRTDEAKKQSQLGVIKFFIREGELVGDVLHRCLPECCFSQNKICLTFQMDGIYVNTILFKLCPGFFHFHYFIVVALGLSGHDLQSCQLFLFSKLKGILHLIFIRKTIINI